MSAAKPASHLALFLQAVHGNHASGAGTKETSYYTALNNLLDGVGAALSPTVCAVLQLKKTGAGNLDDGLFTAEFALTAYWHNAPPAVLGFTIGGYPVMKKWLSYR